MSEPTQPTQPTQEPLKEVSLEDYVTIALADVTKREAATRKQYSEALAELRGERAALQRLAGVIAPPAPPPAQVPSAQPEPEQPSAEEHKG